MLNILFLLIFTLEYRESHGILLESENFNISLRKLLFEKQDAAHKYEEPFIIGGTEVTPQKYTFMVALFLDSSFFCGGSLLNEKFVISAAHCFDGVNETIDVGVGMHDISGEYALLPSKRIFVHPNYTEDYLNDIAIIELSAAVNHSAEFILLPEIDRAEEGMTLNFLGWGRTEEGEISNVLLETNLTIVPNDFCLVDSPSNTFCTWKLESSTCQGDSGGPLFEIDNDKNILVGLLKGGRDCYESPDVFVKVFYYKDWIEYILYGDEEDFI